MILGPMILAHSNPVEHAITAAGAVVLVGVYLWQWGSTNTGRRHAVAFCVGVAVVSAAISVPMERLADRTFTGHMVQHLLLSLLAPPLLVLGRPLHILGPTMSPRPIERALRTKHLPGLTLPLIAWLVSIVVLFGLHTRWVYDTALHNSLIHATTHLALVGSGMLVWHAVLRTGGPEVIGARPFNVGLALGMSVPVSMLGMWLTTARQPVSTVYVARLGFDAAVNDQHAGGALMWVIAMVTGLSLTIVAVMRWAGHEQRVTERLEAITERTISSNV